MKKITSLVSLVLLVCLISSCDSTVSTQNQPVTSSTPVPTVIPTLKPTSVPTVIPTVKPTTVPTAVPTVKPTPVPTPTPNPLPLDKQTFDVSIYLEGTSLPYVKIDGEPLSLNDKAPVSFSMRGGSHDFYIFDLADGSCKITKTILVDKNLQLNYTKAKDCSSSAGG